MAKTAPRMKAVAPRNGTDISALDTAVARRYNRFGTPQYPLERGNAAAVVVKQCTKPRHLTMYLKICAVILLLQMFAGFAFAQDKRQPAGQPGGILQGTAEEQAACAPDSNKFCRDAIPDTFRVLACLQENRRKLRKACLKVLEDHGQ
jgi:hypothetical protein